MSARTPHFLSVKAEFDGEGILVPDDSRGLPARKVIVIFEDASDVEDQPVRLKAHEGSFARVSDDPEDAIYDRM
jgi:hypothetical protein